MDRKSEKVLSSTLIHGLTALLVVRLLTVVTDNLLRWLAIGLGKRAVDGSLVALVLTVGTAGFVFPFIFLAWLAGHLADRYPKRKVIIWCKCAEVAIVAAAAIVIAMGVKNGGEIASLPVGLWLLLMTVMVIGAQAAILSPSLVGSIPEVAPTHFLAKANGLFSVVTLAATLIGMALGGWLADISPLFASSTDWWRDRGILATTALLLGTSLTGLGTAFLLDHHPAADPGLRKPWNAFQRTWKDLQELFSRVDLRSVALGIVFFWGLASVVQLNIDQLATEGGATTQSQIVPMLVALVAGIGVGSLLAGSISGEGIDLGLVPAGAMIIGISQTFLFFGPSQFFTIDGLPNVGWVWSMFWLFGTGCGAGLFDVPLEAYLQQKSPPEKRGAILAATNLLVFTGMFGSSLVYGGLRSSLISDAPLFCAKSVCGLFAVASLLAGGTAIFMIPRETLRLFVSAIANGFYRFRIEGAHNVPKEGPVIVTSNHLSWLDGFIVILSSPRPMCMVAFGPNVQGRFLQMLAKQWRFILFDPKPKSIGRALDAIQATLKGGEVVGIFPEGGISRTGQILGFKRGIQWIADRCPAQMVPLSIDGMWGSVLSFSEGRCFTKWPKGFRRPLTLTYGPALPQGTPAGVARMALQEVAAGAVARRMDESSAVFSRLNRWLRRSGRVVAFDAKGTPITSRQITRAMKTNWTQSDSSKEHSQSQMELRIGKTFASFGSGAHSPEGRVCSRAILASIEAFDACTMLRRTDRLLSSLHSDHPMYGSLSLWIGCVTGYESVVVDSQMTGPLLMEILRKNRSTVWIGHAEQLLSAKDEPFEGLSLEVIVLAIENPEELEHAEETARDIKLAWGLEPIVAFSPREAGGLVSMNVPENRSVASHEVTRKKGTFGRVINGVVIWPDVFVRSELGMTPFIQGNCSHEGISRGVIVGATIVHGAVCRSRESNAEVDARLGSSSLPAALTIDDDGFLVCDTK